MISNYLDFSDFSADQTADIVARAMATKAAPERAATLAGRMLLLIFEHASTRTRVSFASAMIRAGGGAFALDTGSSQMGRGESIADTARAVSGMCDAVVIRAQRHETIVEFAAHAACPVINGLSDRSHPCQALADVMTYQELRGSLQGRRVAWLGDLNNVFFSWAQAAGITGASLAAAGPASYLPARIPEGVKIYDNAADAVRDADLVMTDVWASMGCEDGDAEARRAAFAPFAVDASLMKKAAPDAVFMHCLPAHRGEEVTAEVIDGPQSAVWQQAENRLHAQRALLETLILGAKA